MAHPPPQWASFFSPDEFAHFLTLIRAYFAEQGQQVTITEGTVITQNPSENRQPRKYSLTDIAKICHQRDQSEWPSVIASYFATVQTSAAEQKELEAQIDNFDKVSELLTVRLWPQSYLAQIGPTHFVYRQDLEGTISALVFDLPHSFRQVKPDEAAKWGKETEELFEIALHNVRQKSTPQNQTIEIERGVEIILATSPTMLFTTHALLLDEHPEYIGQEGTLVGIPNREVLLCYPINDLHVVQAISGLIPIVNGFYTDGPGSISPHLYWYHDGHFTTLPYKVETDKISFFPPDEFVTLLNRLSAT